MALPKQYLIDQVEYQIRKTERGIKVLYTSGADSKKILEGIENAGAIFLGKWTPEAVGDYLAGPNHTLPTSGNARFSGSLGVETFMKNTSIIEFNEESLKVNSLDIINLAKSEGLHSHANSVQIRFED